jgi:hypothetical protein
MSEEESDPNGEFSISVERIESSMELLGFVTNEHGFFIHHKTGDVLRSRTGDPVSKDDRLVYLDHDEDEPNGHSVVPVKYDEATEKELEESGFDDVDPDNPAYWGNTEDASWEQMKEAIGFESRFDDEEWDDPQE